MISTAQGHLVNGDECRMASDEKKNVTRHLLLVTYHICTTLWLRLRRSREYVKLGSLRQRLFIYTANAGAKQPPRPLY